MKINKSSRKTFYLLVPLAVLITAASGLWLNHIYVHGVNNDGSTKIISDKQAINKDGTVSVNSHPPKHNTPTALSAPNNQTIVFTANPTPIIKPSNSAVLTWHQTGSDGVKIEVRTKNKHWSEWTEVSALDGGKDGTKDIGPASALVIAEKINEIQYRVKLEGQPNAPSSEIDFSKSELTTIDSTHGPNGKKSALESIIDFVNSPARASAGGPSIISRSEWGAPEPTWSSWPPDYAPLGRAIVHHTATTETSDSYANVRAIWEYHARSKGWGDIGYNYIVDSSGRIFQGRYFDPYTANKVHGEVVGGHAYGNNTGTVGVSVLGDFRSKVLTPAAESSVSKIIGYQLAKYNIHPTGYGPYGQAVIGHYQVGGTECPGTNIISRLDNIRQQAAQQYNYYLPYRSFVPLSAPTWMEFNKNSAKRNPDTMEVVDGIIPAKTQMRFVDRGIRNGVWYYRTEYDASNGLNKGIHEGSISKVSSISLPAPKYMELASDRVKWDPTTNQVLNGQTFLKGSVVKVTKKMVLNGIDYYQTEYDAANSAPWHFSASGLMEPTFKKLSSPLYLSTNKTVAPTNPFTSETGASVPANTPLKLEYYLTLDQKYLLTAEEHNSGTQLAFSQSSLYAGPYVLFSPDKSTKKVRINIDTYKYIPHSQESTTVILRAGSLVDVVDYTQVNGKKYYRTAYDYQRGHTQGIVESDLSSFTFTQISPSTKMKVLSATSKYDLASLKPTGGQIAKETVLDFSSTISINGLTYYRTEYDTVHDLLKGIPASQLTEVN